MRSQIRILLKVHLIEQLMQKIKETSTDVRKSTNNRRTTIQSLPQNDSASIFLAKSTVQPFINSMKLNNVSNEKITHMKKIIRFVLDDSTDIIVSAQIPKHKLGMAHFWLLEKAIEI